MSTAKLAKAIAKKATTNSGGGAPSVRVTRGTVSAVHSTGTVTVKLDGNATATPATVLQGIYCPVGSCVEAVAFGGRQLVIGLVAGYQYPPKGSRPGVVIRSSSGTANPGETTAATAGITVTLPSAPPTGTVNSVTNRSASSTVTIAASGTNRIWGTGGWTAVTSIAIAPGMFVQLCMINGGWNVMTITGAPQGRIAATAQTVIENTVAIVHHMTTDYMRCGMTLYSDYGLVAPIAGRYEVSCQIVWQQATGSPANGWYNAGIWIETTERQFFGSVDHKVTTSGLCSVGGTDNVAVAQGQVIALLGQNNSASAATWGNGRTFIKARWTGP